VIAVDQRNNEDRIKLAKQLADQQVGTLQNLIDQMTTGSLYEGSAVDQRNAILAQITTTKAEADKGTEGAADKLAQLLEQLNSVSKDAYGTTGGFATDRQTILDAARNTIAQANARIAAAEAAAKTDPALTTTNAALDENNAQNADMLTALSQANIYLAKIATTSTSTTSALAALARTS
jgi:primosomal protein N'